jgi:hypothetical protein
MSVRNVSPADPKASRRHEERRRLAACPLIAAAFLASIAGPSPSAVGPTLRRQTFLMHTGAPRDEI